MPNIYRSTRWTGPQLDAINLPEIPITFSVTLLASDWEDTTQTIINSNFIVDGYTYIVSSSSSNINEYCLSSIYAGDVITESKMTFYCQTIPSIDLVVNIIRLRTV